MQFTFVFKQLDVVDAFVSELHVHFKYCMRIREFVGVWVLCACLCVLTDVWAFEGVCECVCVFVNVWECVFEWDKNAMEN